MRSQSFIKDPEEISRELSERISTRDLRRRPEIKDVIRVKKKDRFEFLSPETKKYVDISKLTDRKKIKFFKSLNNFQKIYFNYSQHHKNEMKDFVKLKNDNNSFSRDYQELLDKKLMKLENPYVANDIIVDMANKYEEKSFKFSSLKQNIFKLNPLLLTKEELPSFFLFNNSVKMQKKPVQYLSNIKKNLEEKMSIEKQNPFPQKEVTFSKQESVSPMKIKKNLFDIQKTRNTIKMIKNFDDFFKEKQNIRSLETSRKTSRKSSFIGKSLTMKRTREKREEKCPFVSNRSSSTKDVRKPMTDRFSSTLEKVYFNVYEEPTNCAQIKSYFEKKNYKVSLKDLGIKSTCIRLKKIRDGLLMNNCIQKVIDIQKEKEMKIQYDEKEMKILNKNSEIEEDINDCYLVARRMLFENQIDKSSG